MQIPNDYSCFHLPMVFQTLAYFAKEGKDFASCWLYKDDSPIVSDVEAKKIWNGMPLISNDIND